MALPLELSSAIPQGGGEPTTRFSRVLGIATVGGLVTTYVAKEFLGSALASLQFAEGIADVSMEGVADVCARILRRVSREVCAAIFGAGQGQLVLISHCLISATARAFVLTVSTASGAVDVNVREVLTSEKADFFGSGAAEPTKLRAADPSLFVYDIVRRIREDKSDRSIGGPIQFGLLDGKDFSVMGIHDYLVNNDLKEIYASFYLAGVEVLGEDSLLGDSGFALRKRFLDPFASEMLALMRNGYAVVASKAHWR